MDVFPLLPRGEIEAIVTDPPYSSGGAFRGDRMGSTRAKYQSSFVKKAHPAFTGDNRDQRGWLHWCSLWLARCLEIATPGSVLCMFSDWRPMPTATDALQCGGWVWRGVVVWDKVNARPQPGRFTAQAEYVVWGTNGARDFDYASGNYHSGLVRALPPQNAKREHACQKPAEVMEHLIGIAPQGATVLDPFAGSGTTGVACGRRFIGIERSQQYCEIAKRRIKEVL